MKQKLIYLLSPFTNRLKTVEKMRYEQITKVAAQLTKQYGYAMFLPITQSYNMHKYEKSLKGTFAEWKDIDLFIVREKCDEAWVVLMDGWDKSVGVLEEIKCARKYNKPIKYINPQTLTFVNLNNSALFKLIGQTV